jgi:hypothetical protein
MPRISSRSKKGRSGDPAKRGEVGLDALDQLRDAPRPIIPARVENEEVVGAFRERKLAASRPRYSFPRSIFDLRNGAPGTGD